MQKKLFTLLFKASTLLSGWLILNSIILSKQEVDKSWNFLQYRFYRKNQTLEIRLGLNKIKHFEAKQGREHYLLKLGIESDVDLLAEGLDEKLQSIGFLVQKEKVPVFSELSLKKTNKEGGWQLLLELDEDFELLTSNFIDNLSILTFTIKKREGSPLFQTFNNLILLT